MPPVISIIMPCHNAAVHLPSSVGSVLAQTYSDWELITIDDGSSDSTLAWLRTQTDPRVRIHAQPNQGVSAARNAGLALAQGRYIAFLDADDSWDTRCLAQLSAALEGHPEAVLAYCGWQNLGISGGRGEPFVPPDYETAEKIETLFAGCRWPIHAALVKREAVLAANGFDPTLKNAEDYALWLNVATTAPIVRVPEVLAFYHFHGAAQASADHALAALQFWQAQQHYLAAHLAFQHQLGRDRLRALTTGELLKRGYACYWQRDLPAARRIFRAVMQQGYGTLSDWKYMLPAWLPESWHRGLIGRRDQ
ncbi:MAG TPA: glycosyltransferase [Thiobacillus sp.]|nr:MAG: glycosyl transferase [Hydrogenophilales bacterium 28-61-11]OYZ58938.1 MAG: glycosyl transferase [Hydrogenophilales bacterium 16-61-112]OZA46951.1 MAG: glycosyl transferase [Hydrogenophilales bacterium 17-61-76]HQT30369.1 glycosyltransferase [Thiobacillus sp.]HQT69019.1 glycosyltransferase [Thiobacillus sp.]